MSSSNPEKQSEAGWNLDDSYARLPEKFYTRLNPTRISSPKIVIFNHSLAQKLGLSSDILDSNDGAAIFAGNKLPEGSVPLAQAYAGHQYGHFTMLGDGRAILLGEQISPSGEKFDIQLKGCGFTPYSRGGDGRAALGPMLREYIISEAMAGLEIPTTRSLAVATTGDMIIRESVQTGAVLTRVAASHIRVGTFQYISRFGSVEELRALADYTIERHFSEAQDEENHYLLMLREVIKRQAELIARWQLVGFVHGVMNTDNMAVSGETIDYGPCAFMDTYDPDTVFSSIDLYGRYAYGNQPRIAEWNLMKFAATLIPLLDKNELKAVEIAKETVSGFSNLYHSIWLAGMRKKLGLSGEGSEGEEVYGISKEDNQFTREDEQLISDLLGIMYKNHADYTNTFRALTFFMPEDTAMSATPEFGKWYKRWQVRLEKQKKSMMPAHELMKNNNPAVIPRNHRVEEALAAAVRGDYSVMNGLLGVLSDPYAYSPGQVQYSTLPDRPSCPYRTFCGT